MTLARSAGLCHHAEMPPLRQSLLLLTYVVLGCSGGGSGDGATTPVDSGSPDISIDSSPRETSSDAGDSSGETSDAPPEASTPYPAYPDSRPQILNDPPGAVIAKPVFQGVYFGTDADQVDLDRVISKFATSTYWGALSEYGVGAASAAPSIAVTETAPTVASNVDIGVWLAGKLDGTHPEFGAVDDATVRSKIFAIFYPMTTRLTLGGNELCSSGYGSYHSGVKLGDSGAVAQFIIVPRCTSGSFVTTSTSLTAMMIGAPTDPIDASGNGVAFQGWNLEQGGRKLSGNEIGTACQFLKPVTHADLGFAAMPIWSNAASKAFRDPCLPAGAKPYFTSVPAQNDDVTVAGTKVKGIRAAPDGTADIEILLSSEAKTSGPWTLKPGSFNPIALTFKLDATTGNNGDVVHLHITSKLKGAQYAPFWIVSELDGVQTMEFAVITAK